MIRLRYGLDKEAFVKLAKQDTVDFLEVTLYAKALMKHIVAEEVQYVPCISFIRLKSPTVRYMKVVMFDMVWGVRHGVLCASLHV